MDEFDPLTKEYTVTWLNKTRAVDQKTTRDRKEMQAWMTRFDEVLVADEDDFEYQPKLILRVKTKIRDNLVMLVIPWDVETDWEKIAVPAP